MLNIISTAGIAEIDGKVFIARRKPGTTIGESWEFPGGKAEKGEKPEAALVREYREEFAVDIEVGNMLCSGLFTNRGKIYKLKAYYIEFLSDQIQLREHSAVEWIKIEDLPDRKFAKSDMIIVNCLVNRKKGLPKK